jgi:nucleoid DNA-binding protein
MKKSELDQDPIDKQLLWMKIRTSKTAGSFEFKLVPVIVKSTWHSGGSGTDERYLTVAEYNSPDRLHTMHLQTLQAMTPAEVGQHPLRAFPFKSKQIVERKDLAQRLADRVQVPEAQAYAWIKFIEEEISLCLIEGSVIQLRGFARFATAARAPQKAYSIKSKDVQMTSRRRRLVVKGGKMLSRRLAGEEVQECATATTEE